jgi:hypothetical protein
LTNYRISTNKSISNLTSKPLVIKKLSHFIVLILIGNNLINGQNKISYYIDANLDYEARKLKITQNISFKNISSQELDTLYFTDWSNAYSSVKSPLAQRIVEEYDRSFYLSNRSKFGRTSINSFKVNGEDIDWNRLNNQPDIIQVILNNKIDSETVTNVEIQYEVIIPDDKFTGYGYNTKGDVFLRFWHIALSPIYDNEWRNYSHLNLDDYSVQAADYQMRLTVPEGIDVKSNLQRGKEQDNAIYFYGTQNREATLYFEKNNKLQTFETIDDRIFITDIFKKTENKELSLAKVQRVDAFITKTLNYKGLSKFLIPELLYNKNPFFGLNDFPKFLTPFDSIFLEEISFLKSYLRVYLSNNLPIDLRKDHWIIGGLQTYLIIKYIETYYPKEKFLGRLGDFKLMKAYTLSDIKFNESFWMYYEIMERANLQQSDFLPKDELIKFNEKIGSPYHVGVGLRYLEHYIGQDSITQALKEYFNPSQQELSWIEVLKKHSNKDVDWFEDSYLKERTPIDIKIKSVKKGKDSIEVNLSKYSYNKIPFVLSQVKNDSIISQEWIDEMETDYSVTLQNLNPDYIAVNPQIRLPESNKVNNWRYTKNIFNLKPLQFNFFRDYASPKRNQVYYIPVINYNLYDALSIGSRFNNKGLLMQNFIFDLMPQYSSLQKDIVGKVKMIYRLNNEKKSNFLTAINFFASSYHFDEKLRYQVIRPSINFYFRTDDFRSNKIHSLGLSYYSVKRDSSPNTITDPNYDIFNLGYIYSNQGALKFTTFNSSIQLSDKFSKIELTFDFRRLLSNGSQFTARFFLGKFLHHNRRDTRFFDFNLNRPQDYLFRYSYFGRSESEGLFSQQIVMAEAGFKSKLFPATANDYLLATNVTLGIWKWVEAYTDLGVLKNHDTNPYFLYGSGIRLNILPDYLEIFLPVHSSEGWEIDETPYETKIRFILTLKPKQLAKLFSRKWF